MKQINHIYVNGQFVKPHGKTVMDLINPSTKQVIGQVTLGDEKDTQDAIAAAKAAFKAFSRTSVEERSNMLQRLHDIIIKHADELNRVAVEEYGSPAVATAGRTRFAAQTFLLAKEILQDFEFVKQVGSSTVFMQPLGVIGAITPWNADYTHITNKLAPAIATGCTIVIKPSELSALQTQAFIECLHEAGIPAGVINIVNGAGEVVGNELSRHPDVAMISFTGSTHVGKIIRKNATDTMKRVALELGGKSPNIILDDADFSKAIPMALTIAFSNSGQACHAGSRLIVPEQRLEEVKELVRQSVGVVKVGDPRNKDSYVGPMVSQKQYDTVQRYIQSALKEGAELVIGGVGHPKGLEGGYFVKPTVFAHVSSDMTIAREEIFGPVLSILTYNTEEEAIDIANDTVYGLAAYISSSDVDRAKKVAAQVLAGRIMINKAVQDEPKAPFGGFKQSGIGRDSGVYGLEEYVEPKAILS
jgi:aldehyde dehydrogenase (NAD+)